VEERVGEVRLILFRFELDLRRMSALERFCNACKDGKLSVVQELVKEGEFDVNGVSWQFEDLFIANFPFNRFFYLTGVQWRKFLCFDRPDEIIVTDGILFHILA